MRYRIVKLVFDDKSLSSALELIACASSVVRDTKGCVYMQAHRVNNDPYTVFTYSLWEADEYLEAYRNTDYFKAFWKKLKPLFAERAEAWSLDLLSGNAPLP